MGKPGNAGDPDGERKSRPGPKESRLEGGFKTDTEITAGSKQSGYGRELVPYFPDGSRQGKKSNRSSSEETRKTQQGSARKKRPPRSRSKSGIDESSPIK